MKPLKLKLPTLKEEFSRLLRVADQSAAPPLLAVPVTPLPAPSPRPSLRILRFLNLRA
ncbi:hypothetical protein [Synechococcus sp. M16CYN]|uniref:hypothetical protein n=1 Tax=Synechococcus sp. M16CYN TaxID=3103139 RepID=UPI00333E77A0